MTTRTIERVAVIGAGTMGRGIAAHAANAGRRVDLMDVVPGEVDDDAGEEDRNRLAREAVESVAEGRRPALYRDDFARQIRPGNVEDHLDRLAEADWIVEAVPEEMELKRKTFADIEAHAADDAIVSSNTSGLSIDAIVEECEESFRRRCLVTHFFNPVRVMKLLEIVEGQATAPEVVETMARFGRDVLGKGVVYGKNTPNFVANRVGVFDQMVVLQQREEFDLTFEDVDQIFREPMARPSSGVFKLLDIIGLDTVVHAAETGRETLTDDECREMYRVPDYLHELVDRGWLGRKAGQGFYQKTERGIEALRVEDFSYEPRDFTDFDSLEAAEGEPAERVRSILVDGDDRAAEFARAVTLRTIAYAGRRLGEIADEIVNIDRAMRWGFGWELGPFEIWDAVGVEWGVEQMRQRDIEVPDWVDTMVESGGEAFYREDGELYWDARTRGWESVPTDPKSLSVADLGEDPPILQNESATLHDMGDGVALAEFHTRMNAVDDGIIELLYEALDWIEDEGWRGLVIGNDGDHFSAGANLEGLLERAESGRWKAIEEHTQWFQDLNQRLRYSPVPVVTAPHGYTLGGGAEVTMAGDVVCAHAEASIGLVETGVGIIPGAGGNLQMLRRALGDDADDPDVDPMPRIRRVFEQIATGRMERTADRARAAGFLGAGDRVVMNGEHLLHAAKRQVVALDESGYRPPTPTEFLLPGPSGAATLDDALYNRVEAGRISSHDRTIGQHLARVLCGGPTSRSTTITEERLLELEREAFVSLCGEPKSRERMEYMLEHGERLSN